MRNFLNALFSRMGIRRSQPAVSLSTDVSRDERRKHLGRLGEEAAVRRLLQEGYRILQRNYLCRSGEIDIIAEHRGQVVFVEVKTRSPRAWDTPESAVTAEKQARIMRAAAYYMAGFRHETPSRFDIIGVITDDEDRIVTVELTSNAFGEQAEQGEAAAEFL